MREVISGTITTYAGDGTDGYSGDGGPAIDAELSGPTGVAVGSAGNIFIADYGNAVVRKVQASTGKINTLIGNNYDNYSGDGGAPTNAELFNPSDVAIDSSGNIYVADAGNNVIREISASSGNITTIAGTGVAGYSGDGGLATSATLQEPSAVAVDSAGNVYIADAGNNVIRKIRASNDHIVTVAGNGTPGYSGDGGSPTSAQLNDPTGVSVSSSGILYIADTGNSVVREVSSGTNLHLCWRARRRHADERLARA